MTSRMGTDEVGDDLLMQSRFLVDLVEESFELVEEFERWLPHELQYTVGGVFRCHFQSATDMLRDKLAGILHGSLIRLLVFRLMQNEVVAYTAADEALLHAREGIHCMIDLEKLRMVGDKVRAYLWVDT